MYRGLKAMPCWFGLLLLSLVTLGRGQGAPEEKVAGETKVNWTIAADQVYGHKLGMALTLDVVRPESTNGAAVVFVVSGGWNSNWFPPENFRRVDLLAKLVDRGYVVVMLRHRSAPVFKVPEAVEDVKQAITFLGKNCEQYGFSRDRIGVCGMSAGGHLSLMLGTDTNQSELDAAVEGAVENSALVAAVVAYFPPTDLRNMVGPSDRFPALDFDKKLGEAVSPLVHVTADDAPTLLVHGTRDRLVPLSHSQRIKQAFDDNNVVSELITIEGAGHGFNGQAAERATQESLKWFERYLNPSDQ